MFAEYWRMNGISNKKINENLRPVLSQTIISTVPLNGLINALPKPRNTVDVDKKGAKRICLHKLKGRTFTSAPVSSLKDKVLVLLW